MLVRFRRTAVLWLLCACSSGAQEIPLFRDLFTATGPKIDTTFWDTETGAASFLGRTQLADWKTPRGTGQFVVDVTGAQLTLATFNPTGKSFYGTHAKTIRLFQPQPDSTIVLTARLRLTSLQRGLVYGIYFYSCPNLNTCATNHDEIDFELVTNMLQPGAPLSVQLNSFAGEPLGAGNGEIATLPAGFDPLAAHDWTIRWSRQKIEYVVDGVLLSTGTTHVPIRPMQANVIAWAPAEDWPAAYFADFQPAANATQNQKHTAVLSSLTVSELQTRAPNVSITEYQVGNFADLERIVAGPNGALWFVRTAGTIGRITTAGAVTQFPASARAITVGSDGALWFAGGCIGRITTSGAVTTFPACNSFDIASGRDGALWYTTGISNKIGRITTSGVVTEFTVPTPNSDPSDIVAGPDGALWFEENFGNKIGRITTDGQITEFPIRRTGIGSLTAGPDGAIWFTSQYGYYIERLTTTGAFSEFLVSSSGDFYGITSGPDGALWFAAGSNHIGRITTNGSSTFYEIPTSFANPVYLTGGPDGAIWFTENASGRVGRLNFSNAITISRIANAASYADTAVAPGEIVVLVGQNLGPAAITGASVDAAGKLSNLIAGTRVLFDQIPAPLIYVSETQTAAVVPYGAQVPSTVTVEANGRTSSGFQVNVAPAQPGLFSQDQTGRGQGAVYNEDGALNTPSNPAARGSIISVYGTGEGQTVPAGVDGLIAGNVLPKSVLRPTVTIGNVEATDIRYYGAAPGQTAGLFQINVVVPETAPSSQAPIQVQFGSFVSQSGLWVSIR